MSLRDTSLAFVTDARRRRIGYAIAALLLAILCVVPRPWVARAKLLPQDSSSAGLGQIINSLGGQLSNFANLLTGGRAPNDLYLIIARSDAVKEQVIHALKLAGPDRRYSTVRDAKIALGKKVDVHLLIGGVVEIVTTSLDRDYSVQLTQAYSRAVSFEISRLTRQTTERKGEIVQQRFREAEQRVVETEHTLDAFRKANNLAAPEIQLGSEISIRTNLQAQLAAKQIQLQSLQQVAGPQNPQLTTVQAEIAGLRAQIERSASPSSGAAGPNVAALSAISSRYLDLFRDYRFAQSLYDVYSRAVEQVAVEKLVADSATYIQTVEAPHLDAERHYNVPAIGLLALVILLAAFTEVYVPMTGLEWRTRDAR